VTELDAAAVPIDPLAPLRARYGYWMGLDADAVVEHRDEQPGEVRAMQLILRMERDRPPSWHAALRLAASGAAQICLDPRVGSDPGWTTAITEYIRGHIRKVTRRGRGAQWLATADLPGISLTEDATEVRVMLPGPVGELDKRISKLQVGGTDAPVDEPPADAPAAEVLQVWVPEEPAMTLGKTMAQTGHAGMIAAALLAGDGQQTLARWSASGCPTDVRRVDRNQWAELAGVVADPARAWTEQRLLAVRDAGFTEIAPGTITVIARAPR
jgi:peptidyl-tRNA hydrolase